MIYPQSLFVTGTGTDIGKTLCTALLALHFMQQGISVGIMKPIASGCVLQQGQLQSEDALWLREITGINDDLDLMNPIRFEEPLTPLTAARRLGQQTDQMIAKCHKSYIELSNRHQVVIVEGVGGWLAPLAQHKSTFINCSHLAQSFRLPVVIVSQQVLGTINHSLLTQRAIAPRKILGWIFNNPHPVDPLDVAAQTSPQLIAEISGLPILGTIPFLTDLSKESLNKTVIF